MTNISTSKIKVMGKVFKKYAKTKIREEMLVDVQAQNKYLILFTTETRFTKSANLQKYN